MVTIFETNFATFLVKNYDLKYSLMGTETKRLDEKNSIVHEKNNLKGNKIPKIGLFASKYARIPLIKHFSTNLMS